MKNYGCPKCGSIDIFLKDNVNQKGLYCSEGCGWIKWVSKKELPIVEEFLKQNIVNKVTSYIGVNTTVVDKEGVTKDFEKSNIDKLQGYYEQKKFELEIENNAYNRGIVKGLEVALKIMEVK